MGILATPAIPRIVGRYAIFDEIASGGMATVFLGRLMGAGGFARTVAIKRLHPQFAKDPEFVAMFLDEARLAARIRHPNVVPTLDVVASKGELFLLMEYVRGEALSRLARAAKTRGDKVPLPIVLRVLGDAMQGLHAAHEARDERGVSLEIVHRDVTPQNILVGADGVGRLLDFGVAKAAGRAHTTQEGQIKGKLAYMAPEQLTGTGVSRQTDVYSASVVLWEMLAGQKLFAGGSETDVIAKLLKRDIRRPSELADGIPAALDDVVMRGLAHDPSERFPTARDLCVAIAGCGVAEATGLAVGEWVEGLAEQALAERSARIAEIESRTDVTLQAVEPHPSTPPHAPHPPGGTIPSVPTLAAAPPVTSSGVGGEGSGDETNGTMIATPFGSVRARLLGAGTAAALILAVLVFALTRSGPRETDRTLAASRTTVPDAPPPVASSLVAPVEPAPRPTETETTPPPSAAPSPSASAAPAPPPRRPTVSGPRPQHGTPAPPKGTGKDSVFDSRE
jgi:eukaryotic-like serine/threonine-protein kinase